MRNTFYFTLKAHGHIGKPLDLKDKVNFKFTTSQPGAQTMTIHILPNISRSKGNETMKFAQLIECNMRSIFLEKLLTKWDGETSPRPFSEK